MLDDLFEIPACSSVCCVFGEGILILDRPIEMDAVPSSYLHLQIPLQELSGASNEPSNVNRWPASSPTGWQFSLKPNLFTVCQLRKCRVANAIKRHVELLFGRDGFSNKLAHIDSDDSCPLIAVPRARRSCELRVSATSRRAANSARLTWTVGSEDSKSSSGRSASSTFPPSIEANRSRRDAFVEFDFATRAAFASVVAFFRGRLQWL